MKWLALLAGLLVALCVPASAQFKGGGGFGAPGFNGSGSGVTNFYVSNSGSDSNNGLTTSTPWQHVSKVNSSTFSACSTINFNGGQNFTDAQLTVPSSGTSSCPLTFTSYGTGRATLKPGGASTPTVTIADKSFITFNNINFDGTGTTGGSYAGVSISSSSGTKSNIIITNFTLSGYSSAGLYIFGTTGGAGYSNVTISNFTISSNAGEGLGTFTTDTAGVKDHSNITYQNGTISSNAHNGAYISGTNGGLMDHLVAFSNGASATAGPVGIWAFESNAITIQFSESYSNSSANSLDGDGFDLDGGMTNSVIQYCYSHGNLGAGFQAISYAGVTWANNTIRYNISENDGTRGSGNIYGGITIFNNGGTSLTGIEVYNNTIYSNQTSTLVNVTDSGATGHIANNILQSATAPLLTTNATNPTSLLFTGNDYFTSGTFSITWNSTGYSSFSTWQTATSQEKISGSNVGLTSNPLLQSPGSGGTVGGYAPPAPTAYDLLATSPMIGVGLNLTTQFSINPGTQDFYGNAIPEGSGTGYPVGAYGGGGSGCSQAATFLARNGGANSAATTALICGLVSDGDFSKIDVLQIYATDTSAHALLNLVSTSFTGTTNGTVSFSANHGYTGDASTFYVDTGFNAATATTPNCTATACTIGLYIIASRTTGQFWIDMGANDATSTNYSIYPKYTDGNAYGVFDGSVGVAMTDADGLTIAARTSATALALWKNGVSVGSNTLAAGAAVNANVSVSAYNNNGTVSTFGGDQISASIIGGAFNVANVSARINTYMTALGINKY